MEIFLISILGLVMGFVSAISGGSGVFGVPVMMAMGLPTVSVLAINRMSDVGVIVGALHNYNKSKSIDWKLAFYAMIPLGIGSYIGANISLSVSEEVLRYIILVGVAVGIFFLLKPLQVHQGKDGTLKNIFGVIALVVVGIWSGALGMAGATFAVLVMVYFFRKGFLEARSTDVVAAIPETLIATAVLSHGSGVDYSYLAAMFVSSLIGAWIGSHTAIKGGDGFIRKAMVVIAVVMVTKVVLDF